MFAYSIILLYICPINEMDNINILNEKVSSELAIFLFSIL